MWYADDVKIFRKIVDSSDCDAIQTCLDRVVEWCNRNKMEMNTKKCEVISFTRCQTPLLSSYNINGQALKRVEVVNDLGVLFDKEMNFKAHIDHTVSRSRSLLGFVKRQSKDFKCAYVTRSLYNCLVRSVLEYGSIIWSPVFKVDNNRIESVQRQFLLFALRGLGWGHQFILPSYEARLSLIDMDMLSERRKLACCSFVHDSLSGTIKAQFDFEFIRPQRTTRSSNTTRLKQLSKVNSQYVNNGPSRRCIRNFNDYASFYVSNGSVMTYQRRIRAQMFEDRRNL